MRKVSDSYNPFPDVRDVDCRIAFGVMAQNVKEEDTEVSGSDAVIGSLRNTIDDISDPSKKFASLEKNLWTLDGTYLFLDDDSENQTGWWSGAVSDGDGVFKLPPSVMYKFSSPIDTLGLTLVFDEKANQYATRTRITVYAADEATVIDQWEVEGTSAMQAHQHYAEGYTSLKLEFLETSEPYRRVRLMEVDFGIVKRYDRNSLGEVRLKYDADPFGSALPSRELTFTLDNSDKKYNLLNPDGVYQHLQEGQEISVKMVIGGEPVDMGTFFFQSADVTKSAIAPKILARDRIYMLTDSIFEGARAEDLPLRDAVAEVLDGFPINVRFDGVVGSRPVSMTIPEYMRCREILQKMAQAARCSAYIDRDGVLVFRAMDVSDIEIGSITADQLYDYTGVSIDEPIPGVRLVVQDDFRIGQDGTPGRQIVYYSGNTGKGTKIKSFANPLVADSEGQAVADWLLVQCKLIKKYKIKNRCDPAVELGDVLRIDDIFNNRETAVVIGLDMNYNGTLSCVTKGVGR